MASGFWGINLITDKQRRKAKTIVFYSVLSYEVYNYAPQMEEQLSVLYPNNFIIVSYVKWEEYENLKDVKQFKQI